MKRRKRIPQYPSLLQAANKPLVFASFRVATQPLAEVGHYRSMGYGTLATVGLRSELGTSTSLGFLYLDYCSIQNVCTIRKHKFPGLQYLAWPKSVRY